MAKVLGSSQKDCSTEQKTEDELWINYRQNRDPKIREIFVKQYAPLVKYVAGKVAVGMPHNVEFDDLVGFGAFGLLDAIDKFDPDKGVKFKTYAVTRIRGAIFDELRSIDWVPRSVRQKTREVEEAIGTLEAQLGRTATDQEIAGSLGMDEEEFAKTMMKISTTSILSLNDVWFSGD
ncbi:MAG: sigma-70 family RNA polymerase sigma factor, partial [Treponema sp.]|nr:sigma-70 family RNA polymerase sigma factor [Treponema sp.]